jgi:hypothetical protein
MMGFSRVSLSRKCVSGIPMSGSKFEFGNERHEQSWLRPLFYPKFLGSASMLLRVPLFQIEIEERFVQ